MRIISVSADGENVFVLEQSAKMAHLFNPGQACAFPLIGNATMNLQDWIVRSEQMCDTATGTPCRPYGIACTLCWRTANRKATPTGMRKAAASCRRCRHRAA